MTTQENVDLSVLNQQLQKSSIPTILLQPKFQNFTMTLKFETALNIQNTT